MHLPHVDATEIVASLPLALVLEPYRERLTPLAMAVLQGQSRRAIDRRRELVLGDVWDSLLREATAKGLAELRKELERKLAMLDLAEEDIRRPASSSQLAPAVVDRVLAELLDANDANLEALQALEDELSELAEHERALHAARAARGAYVACRITPNEIRAAIVRGASAASQGDADQAARSIARDLGTRARQVAAREWVRSLARASANHLPLLADALAGLSDGPPPGPGEDLIWIQACIGLTLELGLSLS